MTNKVKLKIKYFDIFEGFIKSNYDNILEEGNLCISTRGKEYELIEKG